MLKKLEHGIKAVVFWLVRMFLKQGRSQVDLPDVTQSKRVLFLRPEKIGDMVISLTVFDALKYRYPSLEISVLASPRSLSLVENDPRFSKVFVYRKRLVSDIRELLAIRAERFDCVLDMIDDDSVTTLLYSQLVSPKAVRIGIGKSHYAEFYDYNHSHSDGIGGHIVDNTMKLLEPFGVEEAAPGPSSPFVPPLEQSRVDQWMTSLALSKARLVGVNLSAGMPNRIWPQDRSLAFCQSLMEASDTDLIVIVAPNDRVRGQELVSKFDSGVNLVPPGLTLVEVSWLISRLDLLVSPDTSLIHIARSFDVQVVGLYATAAKNFQRWRPYRQADGAVVGTHHDNIYDITAEQVSRQCDKVWQRVTTERAG